MSDETITKRIHVSGLTPAITPADLAGKLGSFGTVKALDGFGALNAVGEPKKFGYVTIETTKLKLAKCMNLLSGVTWKGAKLRLGEAQPDFRERIAKEHQPPPEDAPPRKKRRLAKGVQGIHAADMTLVTAENVQDRGGWRVTPLGRIVRPIRVRPEHPLPEPLVKAQEVEKMKKKEKGEKGKEKGKRRRVREPPTRARRRTIDPTKWGSQHLKGAFLEANVAPVSVPPLEVEDSGLDTEESSESEDDEDGYDAEEEEMKSEKDKTQAQDTFTPVPNQIKLTTPIAPSSPAIPNPSIPKAAATLAAPSSDLREETKHTLGFLQSLFGSKGDDWGGEESAGSDVDMNGVANAKVLDGADGEEIEIVPREIVDVDMAVVQGDAISELEDEDVEDEADEGEDADEEAGEEQDVEASEKKPDTSQAVQKTKLKDLFAPREEEAGFSLLGHLELEDDLDLDEDILGLNLGPSEPVAPTFAVPPSVAVPSSVRRFQAADFSVDTSQTLFFPLSLEDRGAQRNRVKDPFDVAKEKGWDWPSLFFDPKAVARLLLPRNPEMAISSLLAAEPDMLQRIRWSVRSGMEVDVSTLTASTAQAAIDELWTILRDQPSTSGPSDYKSRVLRSLLKAVLRFDMLPSALLLKGVRCNDTESRGSGGFADVFYGEYSYTPVALKRLRAYAAAPASVKLKLRQAFNREAILWMNLSHPNILQFWGVSTDVFRHPAICMVLPWMPNGNIRQYRDQLYGHSGFDEVALAADALRWLHEIAGGIAYLHQEGIVHGDLHGGNILIDTKGNVKLTDFGMALIADATSYNYASVHGGGAMRWQAPELHAPEEFGLTSRRPTYACDVYSFAYVCVELWSGQPPFSEFSDFQVVSRVVRGVRPERSSIVNEALIPSDLWSLITSCWEGEPFKRPSSKDIIPRLSTIQKTLSSTTPTKMAKPSTSSLPWLGSDANATQASSSDITSSTPSFTVSPLALFFETRKRMAAQDLHFTPPSYVENIRPPSRDPLTNSQPLDSPPGHITLEERREWNALFTQLDTENRGYIESDVLAPFMQQSKLSQQTLANIWDRVDAQRNGRITQDLFVLLVRFMHDAMKGTESPKKLFASGQHVHPSVNDDQQQAVYSSPTSGNISDSMLSMFDSSNFVTSLEDIPPNMKTQTNAALHYSQESRSIPWIVTSERKKDYDFFFESLDIGQRGYLEGDTLRPFLTQSGLSASVLADIWDLVDVKDDGRITRDMFAVLMHITKEASKGQSVPIELTEEYIPPSMRGDLQQRHTLPPWPA
ncbi:hypothetical protein EIP91_007890 [Steccherinum ochraceum]|uniref:Protein kinase domain-containing protein n=1 Tax=Steccherinum ochraceum TaxID=92696 RepID=A0A4R0RHJ9_9APHY|nr:hypothetical protein EIP91_007890 [Steccherinum ochraceum]